MLYDIQAAAAEVLSILRAHGALMSGTSGVKALVAPVFVIRTAAPAASGAASEPLRSWAPPSRPSYLQDLRSVETPDCSCTTAMGLGGNTRAFNGHLFEGAMHYMHHSPRGGVVERLIVGVNKHTYHQHTWPFQLQRAPAGGVDPYFKAGDWHDSYLNTQEDRVLVRWHALDYSGPVVVHCHALAHSDQGMIAVELVGGSGAESCGCDLLNAPDAQQVQLGGEQGACTDVARARSSPPGRDWCVAFSFLFVVQGAE